MAQRTIVKTNLVRNALLDNVNDDIGDLYTAVDNRALISHSHGSGGTINFFIGSSTDRSLSTPSNDALWYEDDTKSFYFYDFATTSWVLYDKGFFSNTGLGILDSNGTHYLTLKLGSNLLASRTLTLTTGDADRIITLSGDPTLGDWFDQAVKTTSSPTFANMTIASATGITFNNTGLHILDTNATHDLIIKPGSNLTVDRTLTFTTGDASRTVTLNGNPTLNDWFDQSVKTTSSVIFSNLTVDNTGLHMLDSNGSHDLILKPGSDLTADKTLTLTTGDSDRTIILNGNSTLDDWFDQALKVASSPTFNALTLTTDLAVLHGGTGSSNATDALVAFGLTATAAEINSALDGITATYSEINIACDGITATASEINQACDLTSNGFFSTGNVNKMVFYLDTAPTGFSIDTTLDDKLVFVTKGSVAGGQTGGAAHSAGTWTQPNHTHTGPSHTHDIPFGAYGQPGWAGKSDQTGGTFVTDANDHAISSATAASQTVTKYKSDAGGTGATGGGATANTWRPAAYNMIVASLD